MSLAEMYEKIASMDEYVEEQVEETGDIEKLAQEYDAAGRIMARGFMDELDKLAQMPPTGPTPGVEAMAQKKAPRPAPKPAMQTKPRMVPGSKVTMPIGGR